MNDDATWWGHSQDFCLGPTLPLSSPYSLHIFSYFLPFLRSIYFGFQECYKLPQWVWGGSSATNIVLHIYSSQSISWQYQTFFLYEMQMTYFAFVHPKHFPPNLGSSTCKPLSLTYGWITQQHGVCSVDHTSVCRSYSMMQSSFQTRSRIQMWYRQ